MIFYLIEDVYPCSAFGTAHPTYTFVLSKYLKTISWNIIQNRTSPNKRYRMSKPPSVKSEIMGSNSFDTRSVDYRQGSYNQLDWVNSWVNEISDAQ